MNSTRKPWYNYTILDISQEHEEPSFQAVVSKFPDLLIFGDTPEELVQVTPTLIEETVEEYTKRNMPIPEPDNAPKPHYSGRIMLRTSPQYHERLAKLAESSGSSMNKFIERSLEKIIA